MDQVKLSEVLSDFARTLLTDFGIHEILDHLVGRIVDVLDVDGAGVTLIDFGTAPRFVAASDETALLFEQLQSELGQGPCLTAYTSGSAVEALDVGRDARYPLFGPAAASYGLASVFTFPLRHESSPLGALDLYRCDPGGLSRPELVAAQTLADVAAAFLLSAQAREEIERQAQRFEHDALHDELTGLANRALLQDRLGQLEARTQRDPGLFAVLFADLDHFGRVNDVYGHDVGDKALIAVARRMSSLVRPTDTLARISGDEFVFLLEDLDSREDGDRLAARITAGLQRPVVVAGAELRIPASVGIAYSTPEEPFSRELVDRADLAMYQVKRRGGGGHLALDRTSLPAPGRRDLEQELRSALAQDTLGVAYQPIIRLSDGGIHGVEALLRWRHPTDGPVPALTAVTLAEQSGLIGEVGRWVLHRACEDCARWARAQPHGPTGVGLTLSVNVSVHQLMAGGFVDSVVEVLEQTGMPAALLLLEITESVFIHDADRGAEVIAELRRCGIGVALDDFGTGYSSLGYLRRFPVDVLKIDHSFVADLGTDPGATAIVQAVISLASSLDLPVIAEGVETVQQREDLTRMGCQYAQGFLFHPALPGQVVAEHLARA